MSGETIVGFLTFLVSITIKLLGEPDQIRRIFVRKSTFGISPLLYLISFASYTLWTMHGLIKGDWVIVAAQSLGILTSGIVLIQMYIYRKVS